jgi:hypothetical protein
VRAIGRLEPEQRLAAVAALALFATLFLPWYSSTVSLTSGRHAHLGSPTFTGWEAFSFVEAAVLLVAVSVLVLLFQRAEGRAFHLPGGDGVAITLAGLWCCFLIVWRMFDKQGTTRQNELLASSGIEWGIFVALFVAAGLAYAGTRIRAAHRPEPPLPLEDGAVFDGHWSDERARSARTPRSPRSRWRPAETPQWSEPDRPVGWLSAPSVAPDRTQDPDREHAAGTQKAAGRPKAAGPQKAADPLEPDTGQLTIPFDES